MQQKAQLNDGENQHQGEQVDLHSRGTSSQHKIEDGKEDILLSYQFSGSLYGAPSEGATKNKQFYDN